MSISKSFGNAAASSWGGFSSNGRNSRGRSSADLNARHSANWLAPILPTAESYLTASGRLADGIVIGQSLLTVGAISRATA